MRETGLGGRRDGDDDDNDDNDGDGDNDVDGDNDDDQDYQDDPGYSLEPRVSEGDRFGREEGKEATVFDFGCRKEPIWKHDLDKSSK